MVILLMSVLLTLLKKINTLSDYDFRVQPGSNVLAKYLDDYYGGLPWQGMNVDFNKIIELEYK